MRWFFIVMFGLFNFSLFAKTELTTQIHDIDFGQPDEIPMIYLSTGQVVTLQNKKFMLERLKMAIRSRSWFKIILNVKNQIIEIKEIIRLENKTDHHKSLYTSEPYNPSILKSISDAKVFFQDARTNAKQESQCFNRAHIWTYEWRVKKDLYSSKTWIFFTRQFIRKHKFEWWFHVAPMVHVIIDEEVKERIMDIKYSNHPLKLKQWTNIFMRDNFDCPVIDKYSDYTNFPETGSCFVMKSSMYYYQPVDLERLETAGEVKTRWNASEVTQAFLEAYDVIL